MENHPVNSIQTDQNTIKVSDFNSLISLTILDHNNEPIDLTGNIEYFFLTKDDYKYYEVTDFEFRDEKLYFKIPHVRKGIYKIEIKDMQGSIYPSNEDVYIQLNQSFDGRKEVVYTTIKEDIINSVQPIIFEHIQNNREFYRGEKGQDGKDGKDGRNGLNGLDGKDGRDGKKGDKGEKGEKGDTGTLANEKIGLVNKIDLTKLSPRSSTSNIEFDLDNGIVNYSNVEWYLSQYVVLNGVKHVFRIEDFLSNPNYSSGRINLQMFDSNSKLIINTFVTPKKIVEVDLTGRDRQEYWLQLRVTNTELFSGFIEKPMLVEGETPVLWNMSEKDRSIYLESLKKSNYHLASIPNQDITGTLSNPNIVNLTNKTTDSTQNVTDNQIYLTKGIWLITLNTYISPNNYSGVVIFYLFLNETQINITQLQNNQHKIKSYSHVIKVDNNALFSLRSSKTSDEETISFQGSSQNNLTLTKLGGV